MQLRCPAQKQSSRKEMEMSMSSKPKENESTGHHATPTQAAETVEASVGNGEGGEGIRRRAYEIYLNRGEQPGFELDDWLQAEHELELGVLSRAQAV
jgi:hypothetical protein